MELYDYQHAALRTAQPEAFSDEYLIPMIIGEIGELFGQRAKAHWHGWDADRLQKELVSEYGDICWGTAILLHTRDISGHNPQDFPLIQGQADCWHKLLGHSHDLNLFYTGKETKNFIVREACRLWKALEFCCEGITGVPFEQVLQANLDKLASRAARGTLVGQGDHR